MLCVSLVQVGVLGGLTLAAILAASMSGKRHCSTLHTWAGLCMTPLSMAKQSWGVVLLGDTVVVALHQHTSHSKPGSSEHRDQETPATFWPLVLT